ncbi:isoprenylcysteine carboxylmethyltransferase family protein [Oricola sp.]|uniref:methyltransferase family protein n=1 Tax=Oricola sp. TaxID=1979950 RepID=UPI0026015A40|nr:isoprenylcysteine carboxylmethyltransferase family protein [Oricola sp.]MCI5076870.1 isoprenylcysteine carboxylmethyltransferase family protein [Oricola sp.]
MTSDAITIAIKVIFLTFEIAVFAGFVIAAHRHFKQAGKGVGTGLIYANSVLLMGATFYSTLLQTVVPIRCAVAVAISSAGALLFRWAVITTRDRGLYLACSGRVPNGLVSSGPYKYVRHPFYLSYIIFWIGTCLVADSLVAYVLLFMLSGLYLKAASDEEKMIRQSERRVEYEEYAARTSFMLPSPFRRIES